MPNWACVAARRTGLGRRETRVAETPTPGIVYLVGGGTGDPGIITVRGLDCIRRADVLVYDRLIGEPLLAEARPDCERIYVGKQASRHALRQDEINTLFQAQSADDVPDEVLDAFDAITADCE